MKTVLGYNIILKLSTDGGLTTKKIAGTTSNTFGITPEIKESITKDDEGFKKSKVTGYGYKFGIEGLVMLSEDGDPTTHLTNDDIVDMVTEGGEFDFVYGGVTAGDSVRKGKAIFDDYSESSDSENEATFSVSCKGTSKFTKAVAE